MATYQTARQLGAFMRELRVRSATSTYAVEALNLRVSRRTLTRAEKGDAILNWATWEAIGRLYRATDDELNYIKKLAMLAQERNWWEDHKKGMPPKFQRYVAMESVAKRIQSYDAETIHGLVQTPSYMRSIFSPSPLADQSTIDELIGIRMRRQQDVFGRDPMPQMHFVMTEGAFRQQVGGHAVHNEQIEALRKHSEHPAIKVFVIPFDSGAFATIGVGPFSIIDIEGEPSTVYIESLDGCRYVEVPEVVDTFRTIYNARVAQAVDIKEFLP